jgi:hypothetical protein
MWNLVSTLLSAFIVVLVHLLSTGSSNTEFVFVAGVASMS